MKRSFKKVTRFISVLLAVVILCASMPFSMAATDSPLEVKISTNKSRYTLLDKMEFTVTVTNTSNYVVRDISVEALLGDSLSGIKEGSQFSEEKTYLLPNNSFSFTYYAEQTSFSGLDIFFLPFILFAGLFDNNTLVDIPINDFDDGRNVYETSKSVNLLSFNSSAYDSATTVKVYYSAELTEIFTISFNGNGNNVYDVPEKQLVFAGESISVPENPGRDQYTFIGWYTDSNCTTLYDFNDSVYSDVDLYAGWITYNESLNIIDEALNYIRIGYVDGDNSDCVTENISLPTSVALDGLDVPIGVKWTSNDALSVTDTGVVTRGENTKTVVLTATIIYEGESDYKNFEINVIGDAEQTPVICNSAEEMQQFSDDGSTPDIYTDDDTSITTIDGVFTNVVVECSEDAILSLNSVKNIVGIDNPENEFVPLTSSNTEFSSSYVLQQMYNGVPVYGRTVTVSTALDGTPNYLNTGYKGDIIISTTPELTQEQIKLGLSSQYGEESIFEIVGLSIYSLGEYCDTPVLTYEVNVIDSVEGGVTETLFVSASTGEIIYSETGVIAWGDKDVNGSGKDELGITRYFPIRFKQWDWFFYYMQDVSRNIMVYNKKVSSANRVGSELNWWTDETENSAYANLIQVYDWYNSNIGRNPIADRGEIKLIVHSNFYGGIGSDNAAWCRNNEIRFWDNSSNSSRVYTPAAAYDVMAHEYTHGVLEYLTGVIPYLDATGAINEAYADIMGCIADGDWIMGENYTGTSDGLRNISDPSSQGYPEQYLIDSNWVPYGSNRDNGGVHSNCTVISYAAYLMSTNGLSMSTLADLWYQSLTYGYNASSQFRNVRLNVIHAAKDMGLSESQIQIINKAFDDVNIIVGYSLSGKVTIADSDTNMANNQALPGAEVRLTGNGISKLAITNNSGNYTVSDIPYGTYTVTVSKEGYITATQTLSFDYTMDNVYNVAIEAIPEEYSGDGYASGYVYNVATGQGVSGLTLKIRLGLNNTTGNVVQTQTTGSGGYYVTGKLPAGNYCVEVTDNRSGVSDDYRFSTTLFNIKVLGGITVLNQNGYVSNGISSDEIRIVLSWGSTPSDLDSHLVGPTSGGNKFHVYYSSMHHGSDAELDHDDTSSYGPETVTIHNEYDGTYVYAVHDYSNRSRSNSTALANSGAKVIVYRGNNVVATYNVPTDKSGTLWTVFSYNSATQRFTTINSMSNNSSSGGSVLGSTNVYPNSIDEPVNYEMTQSLETDKYFKEESMAEYTNIILEDVYINSK